MTEERSGGFSPWPISLWLLATLSFVALSASIAGNLLSISFVLDLTALWPLALIGLLLIPLGMLRHSARIAAPAVLLVWLLAGLALHLIIPDILPSSSGDAAVGIGTDTVSAAAVSFVELDQLSIAFQTQSDLLEVEMVRQGGSVAPPAFGHALGNGRAEISVTERTDPGYFRFSGWDVTLARGPVWEITAASPVLAIDTSGANQVTLSVAGAGLIELATVSAASTVQLSGVFTVVVPPGAGIEVLGAATVPSDWVATSQGSAAPGGEPLWVVVVADGAQVTVSYQAP